MAQSSQPRELLPKSVRVALGAAGRDVDDKALRKAVAGRVALITGASSGIGASTARRLAANGAHVLLVARSVGKLEQLKAEIEQAGGVAHVHPADLRSHDQVDELVADVLRDHGHVDILVNNAGLSIRRWLSDSTDRHHDIERTTAINYLGPTRLVMGLLPSMRARRRGHIVNVSTSGVNLPAVEWSAYIASKTAFDAWLRGVAPEIRADGVHSSTIYMMLVRSPMLGPFWFWRYLPGMSPDEAAGMVCRAIATRSRVSGPWWHRVGGPLTLAAQGPVEAGLAAYARVANPASRPVGPPVGTALDALGDAARLANDLVGAGLAVAGTNVITPMRPDRPLRALASQRRLGATPAAALAAAAALHPGRPAVHDEHGSMTFAELDGNVRALAAALHASTGLAPGRRLGVMCRNHRGFIVAAFAAGWCGADLVPLNTDFAGPQLGAVLAREKVDVAVFDEEFAAAFDATDFAGTRIVAHELDALIDSGRDLELPPAIDRPGSIVMLTSGSTGTPKGAPRSVDPGSLLPAVVPAIRTLARLRPVPRSGEPIVVAPPLYHMYGFAAAVAAFAFGSPVVLTRRFDAEDTLALIERHRAGVLCAVPTMLKRIMDLPPGTRAKYDCSSLRVVPSGAAPLAPQLAEAFMDEFGDVLFNGYGSTEVGAGSLATPADLRAAPGTVGRPAPGVTIRILDEDGRELPAGETGRIFVGGPLLFEGYSGGGSKEMIDGLMSVGDVGHFDAKGRLFIDGRDDEMIVSGGENVFPQEVEELIADHESVADAGAIGVPDDQFGQRLAAFVVLREGATPLGGEDVKAWVKAHLARYKVPRDVVFVDTLPRTTTGKIQRARLREMYAAASEA